MRFNDLAEKHILCFIFLFLILFQGYSQHVDYTQFQGNKIKTQINTRLQEPYFKVYGIPGLEQYVRITPFNTSEYVNTPEAILANVYLAETKKAVTSNFREGVNVNYKEFKQDLMVPKDTADTARNFLLLKHKLTFTKGDQDLAIIKYAQFVDSVEVSDHMIEVIGKNGNWIGTKEGSYEEIAFAIAQLTAEQFWSLQKVGALDEYDYPVPPSVRTAVKDKDGVLNLYRLADYIKINGINF